MNHFTLDLTERQHQTLKGLADLQGMTIEQYVLKRLFPEDCHDGRVWQALQAFLSARIKEGLAGAVSAESVAEIIENELSKGQY